MSFWDELRKRAEGVFAQVNPWDGGKDYQSVVNGQQSRPSTTPQVKRSPAVEVPSPRPKPVSSISTKPNWFERGMKGVSDAFTKDLPVISEEVAKATGKVGSEVGKFFAGNTAKLANTAVNGVVKPTFDLATGKPASQVKENMDRELFSDKGGVLDSGTFFPTKDKYQQTFKNPTTFTKGIVGAGAATAAEVAPVARGTNILANKSLSLAQKATRSAVEGAAYGAGGSAGAQLADSGRIDPVQTVQDAAAGAALGGVTPLLGTGIKKGVNTVHDATQAPIIKAAEESSGLPKINVLNDNEANTLSDYADIAMKRYDAPNDVRNQIVMQARNAARTAGFDITNMTPADADLAIAKYLERRDNYNTSYNTAQRNMMQGGYIKVPSPDDPKEVLKLEAKRRGLIDETEMQVLPKQEASQQPQLERMEPSVAIQPESVRPIDDLQPDGLARKSEPNLQEASTLQEQTARNSKNPINSYEPSVPHRKEELFVEAKQRGLLPEVEPIRNKAALVAEAKSRGLLVKPAKTELIAEAKSRGLINDRSTSKKAALEAEAKRRGLLDSDTPPTEVFGPEPSFPTVKRTAATDFYKGTTRRADLDEAPNVVDPMKMSDAIEVKQRKVGAQFAKPDKVLSMTGGRIDNIEKGTILSESKNGNQRRRMFIRPDGKSSVIEETRNADGSWVEMKEPAIADRNDFKGIDSLEGNEDLNAAAAKAIEDGREIHMYAEKSAGDPNNFSATVHEFNPEKHVIDGGFVRDANNGAILGNHVKIDDSGIAISIGKQMVNMTGITGDPAKWRNMNKATYTMDRILEAAAPNKEIYQKVRKFVIENKQSSEAKMRTDLRDFRSDLGEWRKKILKRTPRGMSQKEFLRDIFYYAERKLAQDKNQKGIKLTQDGILDAKFGKEVANDIRKFDKWARGEYDSLLDRTNEVLRRFGHNEVPKRQNYMTHLQEESLWDKIGIGEDLYRDLSSGISGEANPTNRGQLPGTIAGKTEQFKPTKKYNPFHQTRRGNESMTDPFRAMDAYGEAALFNVHMTESAVRARSVESVFRAAEEVVQKDMIKAVNDDLRKSLKESLGGSRGDLVVAFQEYANALAGKSNQFDRKLQDGAGAAGRVALRVSRMLQKIASNSSIIGNANVTLAQALNVPNTIGTNGIRSTIKGISRMMADIQPNGEPKSGSPASQSTFLKVRYTDAQSKIDRNGLQRVNEGVSKALFMPQVERAMTEMAWQSSYESALAKKLSGQAAIKEADRVTERIVGGRGIGDQPDIYRSTVGRTFLQYTLEVNAALKNVRKDMTPAGVIKYATAVFALNYGMKQLTGRSPLPDFIGAGIESASDFFDENSYLDKDDDGKPDETVWDKTIKAGQRFATEGASMSPVVSAGFNTFLSQDARKALFGEESDLGRYDGSPAAAQVVSKLIQGLSDLAGGEFGKALDKGLAAVPYGGQMRKTTGGITTMQEGVARDGSGKPTTTVDTSNPLTWIQAALFGKNAIPEVKAYFEGDAGGLSEKQTTTFDKLKESGGIESAKEYLTAIMQRREANKDSISSNFADFAAEAKVKLSDGTWTEKDGVVVDSDTGEVVRSYYKKLANEAAETGDTSDSAYDAFVKGYNLKELGGGKAATTGDATLDQLSKLTNINDKKDTIDQAISLIKKSNDGYEKIPEWVTEKYLDKNKIDKNDALYAAKASYPNDTKLSVVQGDLQGKSHEQVIDYLTKGRVESIKGGFWATQGVLADLRDQGVISKAEYSFLNKLKLNRDGSEKAGSGGSSRGSGGGKKGKTVSASELKAANATVDLEKAIADIIKRAGKQQNPKKISYKKRK